MDKKSAFLHELTKMFAQSPYSALQNAKQCMVKMTDGLEVSVKTFIYIY